MTLPDAVQAQVLEACTRIVQAIQARQRPWEHVVTIPVTDQTAVRIHIRGTETATH